MFAVFFWILAFFWVLDILIPEKPEWAPYRSKGRSVIILIMLILLGIKVYPFNG